MQKKVVTEEEIKEVVKEYIERMFKLFETNTGTSTDMQIDCPRCGSYRGIEFNEKGWICLWRSCQFRFSKELMPPTPGELRAFFNRKKIFFNRKKIEERINKFLNS